MRLRVSAKWTNSTAQFLGGLSHLRPKNIWTASEKPLI